jgi:predicted aldo/keto reductase-like oxidoreductase
MSAPQACSEQSYVNEVEAALAYHDGNAEATIATLLEDLRFLRQQLALAEGAMSTGMTRGWRPSYERD